MEYLDGELDPAERAEMDRRLSDDPSERKLLEAVRGRRAVVRRLLGGAAVEVPDLAAVRSRVKQEARTRGESGRSGGSRGASGGVGGGGGGGGPLAGGALRDGWGGGRPRMARAAAIVLLLVGAAGAAAAVPGSPVRAWLAGLGGDGGNGAGAEGPEVAVAPSAEGDEEVAVRVRPEAGRLTVSLEGLATRTDVRVRLVEGDRATVFAAPGTRFRTSEGRVEAAVAPGPVRIEIPRTLVEAVLRVDGRIFLEKRGSRVETPGPAGPDGPGVDDSGGDGRDSGADGSEVYRFRTE